LTADIGIRIPETIGSCGFLFRKLIKNEGDIFSAYTLFLEDLFMLWQSTKYQVKKSGRVDKWDEKNKIYEYFFFHTTLEKKIFVPEQAFNIFNDLQEDLVKAGLLEENERTKIFK
jgi:hypothetical protein